MAIGKGTKTKSKKGGKKKAQDPFARKEWYDVKAPAVFTNRNICKTLVNRTAGTRIASDALKGRVFTVSLGDLNQDEENAFMKFKLRVEDVQGKNCLTNFYGMDFTTDKLRSLIRKWHTMIEAHIDVKTTDGYTLRVFAIGFTAKRRLQVRKTAYAQTSHVEKIRKKMFDIITDAASKNDYKDFSKKLIHNVLGKQIEKECAGIFPLQNTFIRKVKVLKVPKFDAARLADVHSDTKQDVGAPVAAQ
eukprot:GEZU01035865.1.p2 GENE.GEZU01035865.1~~GEZU01035865.1.p2  ORF type:complete len:246 (-),score=124.55 GEZU01035865.1:70-807(-)